MTSIRFKPPSDLGGDGGFRIFLPLVGTAISALTMEIAMGSNIYWALAGGVATTFNAHYVAEAYFENYESMVRMPRARKKMIAIGAGIGFTGVIALLSIPMPVDGVPARPAPVTIAASAAHP